LPPASTLTTARTARSATSSNPAAAGAARAGIGASPGASVVAVVCPVGPESPAAGAGGASAGPLRAAGAASGVPTAAGAATGRAGSSATVPACLAEYPIQNASTTATRPTSQPVGGIRHDGAPPPLADAGVRSRTWPHRHVSILGGTCRPQDGQVQARSVDNCEVMGSSPLPPWLARTPRRVSYRFDGGRS
jgi:hypothetical protein